MYIPQKRDKVQPQERRAKRQIFVKVLKKDGFVGANDVRLLSKLSEERKALQEIVSEFGVDVEFFDTPNRYLNKLNGIFIPSLSNTIFINKNAERPMMFLAGNELTHTIEENHPDLYEFLIAPSGASGKIRRS